MKRHLAFRNYLRKHPNTVKEYGKIKKEAAKLYPNDIEKYCMYKSQIIEKIYKEIAGFILRRCVGDYFYGYQEYRFSRFGFR